MRVTKSDITLELECWVDELSPAQLAAYEKVANEHNAVKNALKSALNANEGKELFNGQVFQAYSFKGKVLQELKDATVPKKQQKITEPPVASPQSPRGRKRTSNLVYLESSDEEEDDMPLAKRIAQAGKKSPATYAGSSGKSQFNTRQKAAAMAAAAAAAATTASTGKASPQLGKGAKSAGNKSTASIKSEKSSGSTSPSNNFRPSEISSVGGLVIGSETKDHKDVKDSNKETKLQGKTFPSLVVLAKPSLKVKDMTATRTKLDSKVKLVLMLTPNKFTEWLIQEGLLKSEQKCANHRSSELKLGVYSDATKFPYTGGYVWISECCPMRFVSVFHGSIFEGAPHPPSCILKLIYHWSCQTNIQNVVQWVKVDNVYIKGVYTWLRAVCTLAVHQKCKKLGGPDKYVEVGVISLGTTSQDGQQRQVKVEVLGVLDYTDKTIRLRAVEPVSDVDRNYKKRFHTILEPLQRWVHKDSIISIDLTVDKMTLFSMGYKNIVQAAATDNSAKHTNSAVMDYLRRIVPRMFQNTLSLLSRQMIQQFLDELVWREQFGTYALQAFNNITTHISEQTRMNTNETLTQRLYQVATNPFKDWSILPANYKETPANTTPKRLKKPINEADYALPEKLPTLKNVKKEKESVRASTPTSITGKRRGGGGGATNPDDDYRPTKTVGPKNAAAMKGTTSPKYSPSTSKKSIPDVKPIKKEDDDMRGLEEIYYGVKDGLEVNFEIFPNKKLLRSASAAAAAAAAATSSKQVLPVAVECPICDISESFDSNEKLQTHIVSHLSIDGKDHQFQCLFCLEKHGSENVLSKHNIIMHPIETKSPTSPSYHCLICQQRHNNLHMLNLHLQKVHNPLELPYCCQSCGYRSSSHRDVVRHFYDDHKNQNFLQCPFCLDIYRFAYKGKVNVSNIENYYMHLRQHVHKKDVQLRCSKCALIFVDKGALKQHLASHHASLSKCTQLVRPLLNNSIVVPVPKVRIVNRDPLPFITLSRFAEYYAFIDGSVCAECNTEIINEEHFSGELKCVLCNYKSCCERAMFGHSANCNGARGVLDVMELPLPNEMHCVCGFSTAIGNKMAHHLGTCGQKSAYASVELAQENTVKRNMLDMLGLVRRDSEAGVEVDDSVAAIARTTASDSSTAGAKQSQEQQPEAVEQEPIQFGEMEAAPIVEQRYAQIVAGNTVGGNMSAPPAAQYHIAFGQPEVPPHHGLHAVDIDMPLIGDLADPNPPATPQFLGEVHTPMFDAVAAAEQQHYHQLIQQQPPQQNP